MDKTVKVSANEALESALLWAFTALLDEIKKNNGNLDNLILREIKGIHFNTTKGDLPDYLRKALIEITRSSMGHINSKGLSIRPTTPS